MVQKKANIIYEWALSRIGLFHHHLDRFFLLCFPASFIAWAGLPIGPKLAVPVGTGQPRRRRRRRRGSQKPVVLVAPCRRNMRREPPRQQSRAMAHCWFFLMVFARIEVRIMIPNHEHAHEVRSFRKFYHLIYL